MMKSPTFIIPIFLGAALPSLSITPIEYVPCPVTGLTDPLCCVVEVLDLLGITDLEEMDGCVNAPQPLKSKQDFYDQCAPYHPVCCEKPELPLMSRRICEEPR
ncbi:hypothetical protein F5Y03DRAFT_353001 [Xylaria venustula]|nr:hypothetical protein F5Y03DRAFT_353001 [Xylaria venustula]